MALSYKGLDFVREPILPDLGGVNRKLNAISKKQPLHISNQINHLFSNLGKGVRPIVTLLAAKFHDNDGSKAEIMASAVELLHIGTLVHDDVVDEAETRRGVVTISKLWGHNIAVLVGDYLFAESATLVCETDNIRVIKRFSETIMDLSSGQLNEHAMAYNLNQTKDGYLNCISLKTASLFETACETGAILSRADEKLIEALKCYGRNLGMGFQIIDDILDIDGSQVQTGKPIGQDLMHGIITLPSLLALNKNEGENPINYMFNNSNNESLLEECIKFVQDKDVLDECYQIAQDYCDNALESLNILDSNRYKESLIELASYVINRRN
ncbi:uncharacterized protein METZ01_LOCUS157740 [marine metagenome]|uniref:Polyprenyl synthetase family protein n=1 Tax=marine metagenome TaxID=408172 RepID=A0A382ATL9_9ZZZZ